MKKKQPNKKAPLNKQIEYWDELLKLNGFKDIEERTTGRLRSWSGEISIELNNPEIRASRNYTSIVWKESQAEYYRIAGQLLFIKKFRNDQHKRIWELHSNGLTLKAIAASMGLTQRQVRYAVSCMRIEFGLCLSQTHIDEAI